MKQFMAYSFHGQRRAEADVLLLERGLFASVTDARISKPAEGIASGMPTSESARSFREDF
jgi:hypothetical protein